MKANLMKLEDGTKIYYRKGKGEPSSDEQAIQEVLVKKAYRRVRDGFDVKPGERWLDLGANIGAFAVYCRQRGATALCFEPEPECFKLLQRNAGIRFTCFKEAVTASKEPMLTFRKSRNPQNNYRGTVLPVESYVEIEPVGNFYAGDLVERMGRFDGIKMDIEGSEGPIIDEWLLPRCSKLVMEYHTSRDRSILNLKRRILMLESRFEYVRYPKVYDDLVNMRHETFPRFDQLIFCWGAK